MVLLISGLLAVGALPVSAAASSLPHEAVGGFATPNGGVFSLVFADGSVRPGRAGDAFSLPLNAGMTGGAIDPANDGYWEVGADGGVFSYGAPFHGSMGNTRLNQPVFSIASSKTGRGYWLVARDGGIFGFGDARFYGSAAKIPLRLPIVAITTSPTGHGYRLVARDGGIFGFGDAPFYGSLPGRGANVTDVIGTAATPTGHGYWIARSNGMVSAFGDAHTLGNATPSACDPVSAIIANSHAQGYRLVTESGTTMPFGTAPGGNQPTGTPRRCGQVTARIEVPSTTIVSGATVTGYLITDNETGAPLRIRGTGPSDCQPSWALTIANDKIPNLPIFLADCVPRPLVIPAGEVQTPFVLFARTWSGNTSLPPGQYQVRFVGSGSGFPLVLPVPIRVLAH